MKRLKYGLLAAAMVASSAAFIPASADAAEEGWVVTDKGRWYQYEDGSYAKNEFIGGYYINSAGWVDDTTTYSWQKLTRGDANNSYQLWQFGNTKWLAGLTKGKNQWWKIDGEWYYFHGEDGAMGQNEFVGKYYVTQTGQWDPDVRGSWEKQSDGTWKFKVTTTDTEDYLKDGWYTISGFEYHFGANEILDTWKVIVDDADGDDTIDVTLPIDDSKKGYNEVYALGANGHLGRWTAFDLNETIPVEYDVTFKFNSKADAAKAVDQVKNFLLGAYYNASMKPGETKEIDAEINGFDRTIIVGLAAKYYVTEDQLVVKEDGTVEFTPGGEMKPTYTPNVCVTVSAEEATILAADEYFNEKGTKGSVSIDSEGRLAIPLNNYAKYFFDKDNVKEFTACIVDSLEDILDMWKGFSVSTAVDFDVEIEAEDAEVKISHLGMSSNYFIIKVDGKNYNAYYDTFKYKKSVPVRYDEEEDDYIYEEVEKTGIQLFFLSNVSQTLGRKLYDADIVDGYWVYNCLDEEFVSSLTDDKGKTTYGYVSYWAEDYYAGKAATSVIE